jgi:pSer/pThr/pTyr-binding forkhead associated (FHA) protein
MTTTLPSYRPEGRVSPEPFIYEVRPGLRLTGAAENAEVALGRDPRCDIVLPDPTVSRLHARLRPEPHTGVWTVTDAESHNGTFQDGVLIVPGRPSPLFGRALLRLGHAELLFLQPAALKDYVLARALPPPVRLTRRG